MFTVKDNSVGCITIVVSLEAHENSGNHFHMAIKLSSPARWLKVRKFADDKYGIKLNFSDSNTNYYTAYEYVVKEDPNFVKLFSFIVETPRKFIIAELSIRKLGSSSVLIIRQKSVSSDLHQCQ